MLKDYERVGWHLWKKSVNMYSMYSTYIVQYLISSDQNNIGDWLSERLYLMEEALALLSSFLFQSSLSCKHTARMDIILSSISWTN
jgi:hypothetical protein